MSKEISSGELFVNTFRNSSPYILAHRGGTLVLVFGGEAVADPSFPHLVHDIALLHTLGIRLVLVHGARPQIEERLRRQNLAMEYIGGLRITDDQALACVKEAAGTVRVEIEALLSMGVANSPMAGARLRVSSGNFVTARPLGVRGGVDYCHTGEVRRIDGEGIRQALEDNAIVLLSPIGYSPTGEVFNLSADEVAAATAASLRADKLVCLVEGAGLYDTDGKLLQQLTPQEAEQIRNTQILPDDVARHLQAAIRVCRSGVRRAHLVSRAQDGALLRELFTRDGCGTLITEERYEQIRKARIEDVGGVLELIQPLEAEGILVRRSRELLEMEIERFTVVDRDGMIIACGALYPFPQESMGELACLAVSPEYRAGGRGEALLKAIEQKAQELGLNQLFVLTTRTAHWFLERGFQEGELETLPVSRRELYNLQRRSKIFIKSL